MRTRAARSTVVGVLDAAVLGACGEQVGRSTSVETTNALVGQVCCDAYGSRASTVNGVATAHNGWDIAFINWLVPHDALSSQMAELAPTQGSSASVRDLAVRIDTQQQARYVALTGLAPAWGVPVPSTDPRLPLATTTAAPTTASRPTRRL